MRPGNRHKQWQPHYPRRDVETLSALSRPCLIRPPWRGLLFGCTALSLAMAGPASAGLADWWDIYSGAAETEIRRLNKRADVALAWHYSWRLREVRMAMYRSIGILKPPQIHALIANLEDPDRSLDDLRLPGENGRSTLSAEETRVRLGLPPQGLDQEGIAVIRHRHGPVLVYFDIERRPLVRFGQDGEAAELLLSALRQDITRNPPAPAREIPVDSQVREHMPMLVDNGRLIGPFGMEAPGCQALLDHVGDTPTIALCGNYMPRKDRRHERVGDCTNGQIGSQYETVHLINGGEEPDTRVRWDDCVPKPPEGGSTFELERQTGCGNHPDIKDLFISISSRAGNNGVDIGGEFSRERKLWVHTETFPDEWKLPPLVLRWTDDWTVIDDECVVTWSTDHIETETRPNDQCKQDWRRELIRFWQQRPGGVRQPGNPSVQTRRDWYEEGSYYDCPPPRYWMTGNTESDSYSVNDCTQNRQRTVTSHWRNLGTPGSTDEVYNTSYGQWRDVGGRYDCPPPPTNVSSNSGGGGGYGGGGESDSPGTTYDTDGDGYTDSRSAPDGHYGAVTGDIGSGTTASYSGGVGSYSGGWGSGGYGGGGDWGGYGGGGASGGGVGLY